MGRGPSAKSAMIQGHSSCGRQEMGGFQPVLGCRRTHGEEDLRCFGTRREREDGEAGLAELTGMASVLLAVCPTSCCLQACSLETLSSNMLRGMGVMSGRVLGQLSFWKHIGVSQHRHDGWSCPALNSTILLLSMSE